MGAHVLLNLSQPAANQNRDDSLPMLGFEPATIGMLAHLSDRSAKSHPTIINSINSGYISVTILNPH
jgi:hypothetical protein